MNLLVKDRDPRRTDVSPGEIVFTTMPLIDDGDGTTEWIIKDSDAKAKVLQTPGYPAHTPKPRLPDFYEVRMTPDMGQGVFAKRNIKRGDLVFSERPLLIAPTWLGRAEDGNKYTTIQNHQVMMFEFEKVLEVAVQRMPEKERALFMALYNSHTADGTGPLLGITRTNAFGISAISEGRIKTYGAVANLGSRINHRYVIIRRLSSPMNCEVLTHEIYSCMPNVHYKFEVSSFSFQSTAVRDIEAGEQLFLPYCQLRRTKAERQIDLAPYGFSCNCRACVNATSATDILRKTFKDQILRHDAWVKQPEWTDDILLPSALMLEEAMVAEGLDCEPEFFTLLTVIHMSFSRLGKRPEMVKYKKRVTEYYKIHANKEAFPFPDI